MHCSILASHGSHFHNRKRKGKIYIYIGRINWHVLVSSALTLTDQTLLKMFFVFVLALTSQVMCDSNFRDSYIKKFRLCSLAEVSQEIVTESELDCVCICLALHESGGCEAYQWKRNNWNLFLYRKTLNIIATTDCSQTEIGVMLPKDMAETNNVPRRLLHAAAVPTESFMWTHQR